MFRLHRHRSNSFGEKLEFKFSNLQAFQVRISVFTSGVWFCLICKIRDCNVFGVVDFAWFLMLLGFCGSKWSL